MSEPKKPAPAQTIEQGDRLAMAAYRQPQTRPLQVFAFDPSLGRVLGNQAVLNLPYEELSPGPVGAKSRIAVVDYDASNGCYYPPVDLNNPSVLIGSGVPPSEADPHFHQQMVYAVVRETQRRFAYALGRPVHWRRPEGRAEDPLRGYLRVMPHAFQQANAFYDPERVALFFGYFPSEGVNTDTLPGQTIFTCLSYDIVAHETTHALVDGVRSHFSEPTSADTLAFHEAFADIVALLQHFAIKDALMETIKRTGGLIYETVLQSGVSAKGKPRITAQLTEQNPLVGLAKQFGEAMGSRRALREALGTEPNSDDILKEFEPHRRGSILVAAIFDAYFSVYVRRTRDLLRLARAAGQDLNAGDMHPDLAERLAREAVKTANHFQNICIRALDYCPPVDIQFGEFLRAIITADADIVPDDPWGYRQAIIDAFRLRGIRPGDVNSYSEEALRWRAPTHRAGVPARIEGLHFDIFRQERLTGAAFTKERRETAQLLHAFADANRAQLGLAPEAKIQVYSYHAIWRIRPDGLPEADYVVEFIQSRDEPYDPAAPAPSATFKHRGGATVIFGRDGAVRYSITKRLDSADRLERRRAFEDELGQRSALSTFLPDDRAPMNFSVIHRGC
ncbi:MAG TPA: hypothetical protein VFW47_11460 [Phenylobacterium sp.]|nr:hypothetical protein [Phenylobacterium sp.]